jgi:hypothetical protein
LVALIAARAPAILHLTSSGTAASDNPSSDHPTTAPASRRGISDPAAFLSVADGDLKSNAERLRAAGVPRAVIRAVVSARIDELLYARRKELAAQLVPQPYWKVGFGRIDPKFIAGMNAINKDQMKMLRDALGPGAESQSDDPIGQAMMKNAGGGISSENLKRIQAIQSDYGELMSEVYASTNGTWMPEDHEKLAYLQNEQQDDMAKALSPNDLFEYQLRNSPAAMMLRNNLQAFNPTEDEFRAILKAQQDFDQRFGSASVPLSADQQRERQAHQAELLSNIQDVLGPDRFAEYKQDTDPNYMTTNRLVERLNLPSSATQQVVSLQDDIGKRADAIRKDGSLSAADKSSQLASLADEAASKLTAVLGERGMAAYKQNGGWWLQNLRPPSK